ncbi:MAG: PhzF family phenazine biosynthesis protein [SAR324 cluster bacterium]|nr:PhzF family phenazine biosynthesis protein [SAR324 cluster bacterium]
MALEIVQVDAFTAEPFVGNPAVVCFLPEARQEAWMQKVAAEMNTSGTAFLVERAQGWDIRFFTPATEVKLSGHTTLSSAHVLWESGRLELEEPARFFSAAGELTATRDGEWIELDFPALPEQRASAPPALLEALGLMPVYVGRNAYDYLVVVDQEATVRDLRPDFPLLTQVDTRGVMVTAQGESGEYDFVSRFFAPAAGLPEDPVTGSAHCCLGPYWAKRLGKEQMLARQLSARGGAIRVRPEGERVVLAGQAVTVLRGELLG